jgi:ribonuclease BN (tRNA processing enzyme)
MQLTILGSGTATPSLNRNSSGLVISVPDLLILVDIGPGTLRRMLEAGIDVKLIDAVLITHFHPDHVSDLAPFLFASNYSYGAVREKSFYVIGPEGLEQFYQGLVAVYKEWIVPKGDRLKIKEMSADSRDYLDLDHVHVLSAPSPHMKPSVHYRIEGGGVSVTVSGDTDMSDELIDLGYETDLLICECSFPEGIKSPGHLIPSEAGAIASLARAHKLLLTHMYPPCDEVDIVSQAADAFEGEIIKAEDLMTLTV